MNTSQLQATFREWQRHFSKPLTHIIILGLAIILTVVGPFRTTEVLRLGPRFGFWLVQIYATYSVGFLTASFFGHILEDWRSRWTAVFLQALISGIGIVGVVLGIIYIVFGPVFEASTMFNLGLNILLISVVVTLLLHALAKHQTVAPSDTETPLLDRLPFEKRGPLVSISVEDHYVRVRTTKGEEILLLRLSDAIKETGATQGLQVHRSHWIALDQVTAARRDDARAILTMRHGPEIPVSRANIAAAKEAGLIPR